MPFVDEPRRLPLPLRWGVNISERVTGRRMVPARLLARAPRLALGMGLVEALVEHRRPSPRVLRLVRLTASLTAGCAFCLDMNWNGHVGDGVTEADLVGLRWLGSSGAGVSADEVGRRLPGLAGAEVLAVRYAHGLSLTPAVADEAVVAGLRAAFGDDDLVRLATTIAQVNLWARFNVGLGVPPAGFTDQCAI